MVMLNVAGASRLPGSEMLTQNTPGPSVTVNCGDGPAEEFVGVPLTAQVAPFGVPTPRASMTVGGTSAPCTVTSVTLTVPLDSRLNE